MDNAILGDHEIGTTDRLQSVIAFDYLYPALAYVALKPWWRMEVTVYSIFRSQIHFEKIEVVTAHYVSCATKQPQAHPRKIHERHVTQRIDIMSSSYHSIKLQFIHYQTHYQTLNNSLPQPSPPPDPESTP